jgi:gliding motility-associated-like protein
MKRILLSILILLFYTVPALANHITGGEMFYTLVSQNGTSYTYRITLKLYRDCNSTGAPLDQNAPIAIYNLSTGGSFWQGLVPMTQTVTLQLGSPDPCINNPPVVCYNVGYYEFEATLPANAAGYLVAYQRCCRISGINNLSNSSAVGATYTAQIPGTAFHANGPANSSAKFIGADTVIVCQNSAFCYNFGAADPDPGDSLAYYFCTAYTGGTSSAPTPNPPSAPPYTPVPYNLPYKADAPLGDAVTIDPRTGMVCGIAPPSGIYVVTVCVAEYRDGILIATQRKDLQIKVGDCDIASANLDPEYITCDGFTRTFVNNSPSPLINSYYWDFGDPVTGTNNTSTLASPTHTFSDTGIYVITLITNKDQPCSDTATAIAKVYPGFFPGFTTAGVCYLNPVQFIDTTRTVYGVVDSWSWNFGDVATLADTSHNQNPQWTYPSPGPKTINFIVTSSKGCRDTVSQTVTLLDRPVITLGFNDTLICRNDNVQLQASGTGNFSWTPPVNIVGANTATPTVSPSSTTTYYVQLNDQGCINTDSVKVRVINFVTLNVMPDTVICATDPAQLRIISDGLQYQWTPAAAVNNPTIPNPVAIAGITNTYTVTARIGSCTTTRSINVTAIPYPVANAGPDTTMCYNVPIQLRGAHDGSSFTWTPTTYLTNANTLTPTANPPSTRPYVLSSFDTRGCPKPGRDTVLVTVLPKIQPWAGRDTAVIVGQPLQLNAEGGVSYLWSPSIGLNSTTIANPIGIYDGSIDTIRYKVLVFNQAGCADSAYVTVSVFKTVPSIFVATAFTPNNDGLNDVIRPVAVGIKQINYFSIYNRWGQLVFKTSVNGHGWDGRIKGVPQGTNVFVWMVSAIDYLGKPYFQKGTVTLIK